MSFLPASDEPLSADVYFVNGKEYNYIVDVGSCAEALNLVSETDRKRVILTHFHEDHTWNIRNLELDDKDLYVGNYTAKTINRGTVVREKVTFTDGPLIEVIPMPSSHAKGCLSVLINREILLMGDSYYNCQKGYNVSLLYDQIRLLKELEFETAIMSHDERHHSKRKIIRLLESYYACRKQGEDYV